MLDNVKRMSNLLSVESGKDLAYCESIVVAETAMRLLYTDPTMAELTRLGVSMAIDVILIHYAEAAGISSADYERLIIMVGPILQEQLEYMESKVPSSALGSQR